MHALCIVFVTLHATAFASPIAVPTVVLDSANVTGISNGTVHKFLGIPYASPPVGRLRFRKAEPLPPYDQPISATAYGYSCVQQIFTLPSNAPTEMASAIQDSSALHDISGPEDEDCLTVNVIRPAFSNERQSFPVIVWIYGGGFEAGDTKSYDAMGTRIVQRSVDLTSPVLFVSMNYRVSAYGFLASQEVMDEKEGNLGLLDQRRALSWVQRYIRRFGGDRTNVLLWGESAGAISVSLQMLAYGGTAEGLFHAAFMQSGSPIPVGNITGGQKYYDFLVSQTNCQNEIDTLECLRQVPFQKLKAAVDKTPNVFSYQSLVLAWTPRADGIFLVDNPQRLVLQGKVASIPYVTGNCDDEGTLFSLSTTNITTEDDFRDYIGDVWLPEATTSELKPLWTHYSSNVSEGSPFNTGKLNALTPQFKRLAAFQGDVVFQAPRRFFLEQTSGNMKTWSFLSKRYKVLPYAGSYHSSDLAAKIADDFVINMAANHDPNNGTFPEWPPYTADSPSLFTFGSTGSSRPTITQDTYREAAFRYLTNISLVHPL